MRRDDAGSATVLVLPLVGVVALLAVLLSVLGGLVVAQRRAGAAADLAALAGAASLQRGGDGCSAAAQTADRNGVELSACAVMAAEVRVWVAATVPGPWGRSWTVRAHARSGPVRSQPDLWEDSSGCDDGCSSDDHQIGPETRSDIPSASNPT